MKNYFVHEALEEVYIEIPSEIETHNGRIEVCLLKKVLYGLNQSPRVSLGRFRKIMVFLGYKQSQVNHTLFIKYFVIGKLTSLLLVNVDNKIIVGDDEIIKKWF